MKFPYFGVPQTDLQAKFIAVPWIPVTIKIGLKEQAFLMLVDSGADYCILDRDIASFLGLNITQGELIKTGGLSGTANVYYFDSVSLFVGGLEVQTKCGFINENLLGGKIAGVLGRHGFFDSFKVCIDQKAKEIELKQNS